MKTSARKFATSLLIAALAMPAAPAQAGSFATAAALAGDRERIAAVLARADVQAKARVAALSDAEAAQLAVHIDEVPAAGNPVAGIAYALVGVAYVVALGVALVVAGVVALVKKARS